MIKKLVSHLGEYKRAAVLTPLFAALEAVMDVLLPTIMAFIIDLGIEKGDMHAIVKYGLLTFLVAAIALLLGVLAGKYAAEASTGFAGNLRDAMYENIQHYSFSNIDKFSTAGLVTRMTTDVTNVQNAFQMIERMCVRAPVHLVFALFMAVVIGGPLSLVFVVAVVFLVVVLASIMIPKELSAIYSYKIISKLGLLDTYAAMILPQLGEAIGVFLLYNFFCTIPKEFRESCELDGGGHMTALWRIYLPMAGPVISVMMILSFVSTWNNFLLPLMMVSSDTLKPVTLGLYGMVSLATFTDRGALMMGALLGVLPVIVLFLGLQRYWQAGLAAGAVKG